MQYTIVMTKDEKKRLKEKLPTRWVGVLSAKTGLSKVYVQKVMAGITSHVLIEKEALKLANEYQNEINSVERLKESVL